MGFGENYKLTASVLRHLTNRDEQKHDLAWRPWPSPVCEKNDFLEKGPFFWFAAGGGEAAAGGFLFFN